MIAPPPAAAAPSRRWRVPALAGITALGVALALSAGWWFVRRLPATPPPSESMVAVLPPAISTPDSALSHLARDLAFTLAPNLTGAGDIRAVDPDAVVARLGNRAVARSRPGDLQLGRSLGAGRVVRGSLVRVGREVRWDLDLLSTESGDLVAQATTTALPESLRAFTDTATRSLLRQIWLRGQPPSPSLDAAVKTRSMPALKAFLTGEGRIEKGDWAGGAQAYNDAVAADSSFWLAYWRLWFSNAWGQADVDTTLFAAVRAHRAELPDRERLLIESCTCVADSLQTAIRLAQQVTTRFPDDWFAWLFLGDYLVHTGPVLGYTAADARGGPGAWTGAQAGAGRWLGPSASDEPGQGHQRHPAGSPRPRLTRLRAQSVARSRPRPGTPDPALRRAGAIARTDACGPGGHRGPDHRPGRFRLWARDGGLRISSFRVPGGAGRDRPAGAGRRRRRALRAHVPA